jgi:hypothetical protein
MVQIQVISHEALIHKRHTAYEVASCGHTCWPAISLKVVIAVSVLLALLMLKRGCLFYLSL